MTILVTADLHLGDNPRDQYRHDWVKALPALARKVQADVVLILGDLTEEKDRHGAWLTNAVVDHIANIAKEAPVVVLLGNHDYVDISSPFFALLGSLANVTWVQAPTSWQKLPSTLKTWLRNTLFLPHTSNYKRDWAGFDFRDKYDWIFTHQTFNGANVGFGRSLEGIDPATFRGNKVISGDIHVPQSLGKVTYVGAPYTVDFGDDYEPRVLLLDSDGKASRSIMCKGPQKRLVEFTPLIFNKTVLKSPQGLTAGDIIKARVNISADQMVNWLSMKQRVQDWAKECGYVLHAVLPVVDKGSIMKRAPSSRTSKSDDALLTAYAGARGLDEATIKAGQIIMRKV